MFNRIWISLKRNTPCWLTGHDMIKIQGPGEFVRLTFEYCRKEIEQKERVDALIEHQKFMENAYQCTVIPSGPLVFERVGNGMLKRIS